MEWRKIWVNKDVFIVDKQYMELQGQTKYFVINIVDIDIIIQHRLNVLNVGISIANIMGYIKVSSHQEIAQTGHNRRNKHG